MAGQTSQENKSIYSSLSHPRCAESKPPVSAKSQEARGLLVGSYPSSSPSRGSQIRRGGGSGCTSSSTVPMLDVGSVSGLALGRFSGGGASCSDGRFRPVGVSVVGRPSCDMSGRGCLLGGAGLGSWCAAQSRGLRSRLCPVGIGGEVWVCRTRSGQCVPDVEGTLLWYESCRRWLRGALSAVEEVRYFLAEGRRGSRVRGCVHWVPAVEALGERVVTSVSEAGVVGGWAGPPSARRFRFAPRLGSVEV